MENPEFDTIAMTALVDAIQRGDRPAKNELLRRIERRMRLLCHKMLDQFPRVRAHEDTMDVLQNSLVRLLRSIDELKPKSTRDFFGLAAEHVRRELLDLAQHYRSRKFPPGTPVTVDAVSASAGGLGPVFSQDSAADWDKWCSFHEAVAALPGLEREVVGLLHYHGWSQRDVADLLQVSERQVRRYWVRACLLLKARLDERAND